MPKSLGGPGGDGTNPEQLFAAGNAACPAAPPPPLPAVEAARATASFLVGSVATGDNVEVEQVVD